jgi:hypothetical protein
VSFVATHPLVPYAVYVCAVYCLISVIESPDDGDEGVK